MNDLISTRSIMRLLVLSYFIAQALGWIGSSGMIEFILPLLPPDVALRLMQGLVLGLSLLVLIGIGRRHAALVLVLFVFFSSYTALYAGGDLGAFWRDLALIGALLMTAEFDGPKEKDLGWDEILAYQPAPRVVTAPSPPADAPLDDKQFRKDFDLARVD